MEQKQTTQLDKSSMEVDNKRISKDQGLAPAFTRLVGIMDELRERCPWDQVQTIDTLRSMTLEETYELTDAIDNKDWDALKGELGDILLHLLFYARIGKEQKAFSLVDVLQAITDKMIRRHPHIYGDTKVEGTEDVLRNWQKIKKNKENSSLFSGVPTALPSMVKAARIQEKARGVGFDWPKEDTAAVYQKLEEELSELNEAVKEADQKAIEEELGDVFFSLINYARFLKVDADKALESSNRKFISRFNMMEELAKQNGTDITALSFEAMDDLWNQAKKVLKAKQG